MSVRSFLLVVLTWCGSAVLNRKIYMIGGSDRLGTYPTNLNEEYNPVQ